jgi:CheY-like chemotaxis protein
MATILVIDDDVAFLNSLDHMLARAGYQVLQAVDGTEAVRLLEEHRERIDVAIVDLALPGLNGFEIIGAVSRRPNKVKMIATTAVYKDAQLEVAGALGAHAVIRKPAPGSPIPEREWLDTVRKLIGAQAPEKFARAATVQETEDRPESTHGKKPGQ